MDLESGSGLTGQDNTLMAVLESVGQAVITVDQGGIIRECNTRTLEMFGYSRLELIGQLVEILLPISQREAHSRHRGEYFRAPHVRTMGQGMELSAVRKDASEFPVDISLTYVRQGGEALAIALVSDITERKILESQVLASERLQAMISLAWGAAHDFNNTLTVIGGYNQLLMERMAPGDPNLGYAREIRSACMRASQLAQQLMSFSRHQPIVDRPVSVATVARDTAAILGLLLPPHIRMEISVEPAAGLVQADPTQIEQVFVNLLMNARDALPNGGKIEIEVRGIEIGDRSSPVRPGRYALIRISDNGKGMDEETRRRMFDPFFTTKPKGRGNGLGLVSVVGTVKKAGGTIIVESVPGAGTCVEVYLPQIQEVESPTGS